MSSIPTKQIDGDVAIGRDVSVGGKTTVRGSATIGHNLKVEGWLDAPNIKGPNKGLFATLADLRKAYPTPHDGWFAGVAATDEEIAAMGLTPSSGKLLFKMYTGHGGEWVCVAGKLYEITVDSNQIREFASALAATQENVSDMQEAIAATNNAINNAKLKGVSIALTATGATLTVQSEGKSVSCAIPVAVYNSAADGEKKAGLMSAEDKYKLDTTVNDRVHDRGLISDLQRWGQEAGWMVQRVTHGKDDASDVYAKVRMHKMDEPDSEPSYTEVVLVPGATEEAAGAMTAQQVKDLAAIKNDAFEVILFDHIEESNIAANTSKVPLSASADGCKVVYCRARERFLFGVPAKADSTELTYYNDWEGSERYGTVDSQGVKPAEGKLFIDIAEANGNLLDIYIFREGALRHTGRSLYNYINDTAQSLDALENKVGKAEGIATLDANKLIPEANIPEKYDNIIFFDSVQDGAIITQPGSSSLTADDPKAKLIFSRARDRFVLGEAEQAGGMPKKYYINFVGSARYGSPKVEGIKPASDKVYICRSTFVAYSWNGTTLSSLGEDYSTEFQSIDISIREINDSIGEANGIAPLNASGVVPNENISDEARKSLFCDLFNAAAGTAGYAKFTNGVWDCKLNGLTLSYDEAVMILSIYHTGGDHTEDLVHHPVRTNLPLYSNWATINLSRFAENNTSLEVANVNCVIRGDYLQLAFYGCKHLREIRGPIRHEIAKIDDGAFLGCPKLESLDLRKLKGNLLLSNSPLFKLDSLDSIVTNAANGNTAITITVHADVYAKLTGDTTNEAAAALTADELSQWQALLTKAAGKHIAFASA